MSEAGSAVDVGASEDARLESLGYKPQLNRVLGFFSNFAVGFTYLSPMVGIYSLFVFGFGIAGPAYIWLTFIPLIGMLFVALVFGELASHYPVAGSVFQYSKYSVGPRFGWFVGWFYGFALLITVAAVDTGVVTYLTALLHNWFGDSWLGSLDATGHGTILVITLILLAIQSTVNITGARIMADVAKFGVYVEIVGTLGNRAHPRHPRLPSRLRLPLFDPGRAARGDQRTRPQLQRELARGRARRRARSGLHLLRLRVVRRHRRGDEGRRPPDPESDAPRSDLGRIGSLILTAGLLLATAKHDPVGSTVAGGVPSILAQLPSGLQDFLLLVIIFAFFSCGSSIQGAGSRLAFSYARDGALPGSGWLSRVNQRFKTPVNALLMGAVITVLFCLLVYINPGSNYHIWFVTYPAHVNALVALVSFGVSGIYLSFLLTVIGAVIARARGWKPEGAFRLGKWGWPVTILAVGYLGAMFLNVVYPSGLSSGRAILNLDWITLFVIFIIAVVGAAYLLIGRPDRNVERHLQGAAEPPETPPLTAA
jgi:amino acid transporter